MSLPLWTGKAIVALSLHRPRLLYQRVDLVILVALYGYALHWCYQTAGMPWAAFLSRIQAEEEAEVIGEDIVVVDDSGEMQQNIFDTIVKETTQEKGFWDIVAQAEESGVEQIPHPWQPDFWPLLMLAAVVTLTVLLWLGQDWSVSFKAAVTCRKVKTLQEATIIKVTPRPYRGKADLVKLEGKDTMRPTFVFQKQRWEYNPKTGQFAKVVPPMNRPIKEYLELEPYTSRKQVQEATARYGPNRFEIPLPTFANMYKEQIKAPFFVFQVFCVLLWCLEEYWQYSLFSLVMILGFEASVVMTRRMNITKLRGMGNKATSCQALRFDEWQTVSTEVLLPGDRVRLVSGGKGDEAIIPCDCLMLRGSAVVNEATLTGESAPLMKEAASTADGDRNLDIKTWDKIHTLFGGTKLMEAKGENDSEEFCEVLVLRTGFGSSQGKLVRRIEYSTEKVSGDMRDAGLLLAFLLVFAIAASAYVLRRGLDEGVRSRYDLLIHCILIVTSVVPPDLPMQMAVAINTSLSTLMGMQVFCIEPFRIPMAGKVNVCCFDKTGTITTDRLYAAGIIPGKAPKAKDWDPCRLSPMLTAPYEACLVIAGCHSLVQAAGETVGDPLESSALMAIGWRYSFAQNVARPLQTDKPSKMSAGSCPANTQVQIVHRHHFASKLQRMSVVATVRGALENGEQTYVLAKGSPEVMATLIDFPDGVPTWYTAAHQALAKKGLRVIALAYKKAGTSQGRSMAQDRALTEKNLSFAGFVAFGCKNRADSRQVITELRESSHIVIMITGDSLLTAAHVGGETNVVSEDKDKVLMLQQGNSDRALTWARLSNDSVVAPFKAAEIPALAKNYDLCVTGEELALALEQDQETKQQLHRIHIYARMKPEQKEQVLLAIKATGKGTLMCGDGTNDVGALKAADVGVALLSGFGDVNAEKDMDKKPASVPQQSGKVEVDEGGNIVLNTAELAWINDPMVTDTVRAKRKADILKRKEFMKVYEEKKAAGEWFAFFKASMIMAEKQQKEMAEKRKQEAEAKGKPKAVTTSSPGLTVAKVGENSAASTIKNGETKVPAGPWDMLESAEGMGDTELVKLGDASIAAPFTSKMPSISSTRDIIRQGRCTLISTLQMYQILALNCLISSYSLSVLYLDGIKYGDRQMTLMGILGTICFLCISRGSALPKLAPIHPPSTIFHPALFFSLIGQFVIHLATLMYTVSLAKAQLPPDWVPDIKGKFQPSIVNTVVFLSSSVQQVSVFIVNYKGRPYVQSLVENTFFTTCIMVFAVSTVALATEVLPWANKWLELTPLAGTGFKQALLVALSLDVVLVLAWDRLVTVLFMRELTPYMKISLNDLRKMVKPLIWAGVLIWILLGTLEVEIQEEEKLAAAQGVVSTAVTMATGTGTAAAL